MVRRDITPITATRVSWNLGTSSVRGRSAFSGIRSASLRKNNGVHSWGEGILGGYIWKCLVDGHQVNCILDTGSVVTLIPGSLAQELLKKPVTSQSLPLPKQGRKFLISGVASDIIGKRLLGFDRLKEQLAIWDMRRQELYMYGSVFHLKAKQDVVGSTGWWCRRPSNYPA